LLSANFCSRVSLKQGDVLVSHTCRAHPAPASTFGRANWPASPILAAAGAATGAVSCACALNNLYIRWRIIAGTAAKWMGRCWRARLSWRSERHWNSYAECRQPGCGAFFLHFVSPLLNLPLALNIYGKRKAGGGRFDPQTKAAPI
jgi:hypothetical protein